MFINPPTIAAKRRSAGCRGFSLTEVLVASALSSLLLLGLATFSAVTAQDCAALSNYANLETQSRMALDHITQQIRQTRSLTSCSSTNLIFKDADGTPLEFDYDPNAKTVSRLKAGVSTVYLQGCDYFHFDIFQRNPVGGSYDAYPTAGASTCKLIQFTWICSRTLLGARINTETVQSAKIVIRKQG
jgi:prepilin-type N-terminal cleavage/methylation domain-containing protein